MQSLFRGALLASALTLSACGGGGSDSTSPGVPGGGSSGGKARVDVVEVFHDRPRAAGTLSLLPYLCVLAVLLLLVEIAGRRLALWEKVTDALTGIPESIPVRRLAPKPIVATTKSIRPPATSPSPQPAAEAPPPRVDVFEQAKRRAKRRTE